VERRSEAARDDDVDAPTPLRRGHLRDLGEAATASSVDRPTFFWLYPSDADMVTVR
jgi:hypothetical protein